MRWSDLKNEPRFVRAMKIWSGVAIFTVLIGTIEGVRSAFQAFESRSDSYTISRISISMLPWVVIGTLIAWIPTLYFLLFVKQPTGDKGGNEGVK